MSKPDSVAVSSVPFQNEDLIPLEEVARRLNAKPSWVREKVRRRSPNPIPVMNAGRHLLFDWLAVSDWLRNLPRPQHAKHVRRRKIARVA